MWSGHSCPLFLTSISTTCSDVEERRFSAVDAGISRRTAAESNRNFFANHQTRAIPDSTNQTAPT
jgi:hypothetical protein